MQKDRKNPNWHYYGCDVKLSLLDKDFTKIKDVSYICFAKVHKAFGYGTNNKFPNKGTENIQYVRYYFKQYVTDRVALRFFNEIKKWWFIGEVLQEFPEDILKQDYVTIDLSKHSDFRVFSTLTLIRYVEEFPFIIHEVFKKKQENYLISFVSAHRKEYAYEKRPPVDISPYAKFVASGGHGFFSPSILNNADSWHKKPLEENSPEIIKEPKSSIPLTQGWDGRPWTLNNVFTKQR